MSVSEIVALRVRPSVDGRTPAKRSLARTAESSSLGRQPRYLPLITILAAVCAGIIVDRMAWPMVPQSFGGWWLFAASSLVAWFVFWKKQRDRAAMGALVVSVAAVAGARHHHAWNLFGGDEIGLIATETALPICLEAVVCKSPQDVLFDEHRISPASLSD